MTKYFQAQVASIRTDSTLGLYGAFLALTHVLTFLYWNNGDFFITSQSAINTEPLCFPFFPDCDLWRSALSAQTWLIVLCLYLFISLITVYLFLSKHTLAWAFAFLAFLSFFKLGLHLSNYNFMGNYHYMIYFVSFAYLFVPYKKITIKYLIVAFYVAAGCLKINIDWLSGAALIAPAFIQGKLLSISLFYVILLELILVFGLLSKNKWIRWITLGQLAAFHLFSWHIVGFYYPTVMFCLLSVYFIDEYFTFVENRLAPDLLGDLIFGRQPKIIYGVLFFFAFLQAVPFLSSADPSLSGAPRLTSLNMFDSKTQCQSLLVAHKDNSSIHLDGPIKNLGVRLKCDPLIFLNQAYQLCRRNRLQPDFNRLSLSVLSKRQTDSHFQKILDISDVCQWRNPLWAEFTTSRSQ